MSDVFFQQGPYRWDAQEKKKHLLQALQEKTEWHRDRCPPYKAMVDSLFDLPSSFDDYGDLPYLPVQLFKKMRLQSVSDQEIFKTLLSSGTTSHETSRIILDRKTAAHQTRALAHIMSHFLGPHRLPLLIIDCPSVIKNRAEFSARGAGILGMMTFGRDPFYALHDDMSLNEKGLRDWLSKYPDGPLFIFGFTFMIWKFLAQSGLSLRLPSSIVIHGGGWKKVAEQSVTNAIFRQTLTDRLGIHRIHNFYGMVEQVGSLFMECSYGHLHSPSFSEVLIRDPETLEISPLGHRGLVQVLSILPESYPGHSLLTEDEGTLHGDDDCPCGLNGRHFSIHGRVPRTIARGCSDTLTPEVRA